MAGEELHVTLYAGEMSEYVECCHLSVREASVALEGSYRDRDIYRFLTVEARRPPPPPFPTVAPAHVPTVHSLPAPPYPPRPPRPVLTARGRGLGR